jgi:hypothetical protein
MRTRHVVALAAIGLFSGCSSSSGNSRIACESVEFFNDPAFDECKITARCGSEKRQIECVQVTDGWDCVCVLNDKEDGARFRLASCMANEGAYENAFQQYCDWNISKR